MKKFIFTLTFSIVLIFSMESYSQQTYGWSEQNSGFNGNLYCISAVDSNVVWISGDSLTVLKTTNGGINWNLFHIGQAKSKAIYPIYNIFAMDANNAICTGSTESCTYVFKTTDGGNNWNVVFTESGGFIDNIYMFSSTNGFMNGDPIGNRASFWKTTDGGNSWDSTGLYYQSSATDFGICNSFFVSDSRVWFGTFLGNVYYSTNYGNEWTEIIVSGYPSCLWSNYPLTGQIFMGNGMSLLYSTDFGFNWNVNPANPGNSNYFTGITGSGEELWCVTFDKYIYYSTDYGMSWITQYTATNGNFMHILKARNGNNIWAIKDNGGILKYGLISGIVKTSKSVSEKFKLYQNYPNPFNSSTKISYELINQEWVVLKIYDILGKELITLENSVRQAGMNQVIWNGKDINGVEMPSGVYFVKLVINEAEQTKKITLLK